MEDVGVGDVEEDVAVRCKKISERSSVGKVLCRSQSTMTVVFVLSEILDCSRLCFRDWMDHKVGCVEES